jgi:S-adenosyl-L-methionine hydrolase (adenosine-forming)
MNDALITLTTDFGTTDYYVGVVKGVIAAIAPQARIIDITHNIKQYSVMSAAWVIAQTHHYFPDNAIHVAVVDPAVGSEQRPIALRFNNAVFVGPDNGIFSGLSLEAAACWELTARKFWRHSVSSTFHARDIYGPVAAHLANGVELQDLGCQIDTGSLTRSAIPQPQQTEGVIAGRVVYIDHYGNLITNIPSQDVPDGAHCIVGSTEAGFLSNTYCSVSAGNPVVIRGSHGFIEVSLNQGAADEHFQADVGTSVFVT